jgi:hypothetical protein
VSHPCPLGGEGGIRPLADLDVDRAGMRRLHGEYPVRAGEGGVERRRILQVGLDEVGALLPEHRGVLAARLPRECPNVPSVGQQVPDDLAALTARGADDGDRPTRARIHAARHLSTASVGASADLLR